MWKLTLLQNVDEIPPILEEATVHGNTIIEATYACENLISAVYPAHIVTVKRTTLSNVASGRDVFLSASLELGENKFIHNALIYSLIPTEDEGG